MKNDSTDSQMTGYAKSLVSASEGLMELVDRDRYSPAYGCFFYPYWRSKTSGYVNARCQEAVYTLALIYRNDYPGNRCRGVFEARELARAGMLYWARLQHPDGSFDEWYRGEHGFAATAFSAFAVSRAFTLLRDELAPADKKILLKTFRSAAGWLQSHDDLVKINHEAVVAAALYSLGEVLDESALAGEASRKVDRVLDRQTGEGWFPELGGLDTGYSFLTLEYLSQCYLFSPRDRLKEALERALGFLVFFVHPDITTGREYNLCGNSYVSLLAAAIMARFSPIARRLFSEGIARGNVIEQLAQDDLSRCYHLYNGLLAYDRAREVLPAFDEISPPLPCLGDPFRKNFPESLMTAVRKSGYYGLVSANCGGLLKLFSSPGKGEGYPAFVDRGYSVRGATGTVLHSFLLSRANEAKLDENGVLKITASFRPGSYLFPGPLSRLLLDAVSSMPGGYHLVKSGVDFFRRRKKASFQLTAVPGRISPWRLKRTITFRPDLVLVRDEIKTEEGRGDGEIAIDLEERDGSRVVGRPLSGLEDELRRALVARGKAVVEKELRPTASGVKVTGSVF